MWLLWAVAGLLPWVAFFLWAWQTRGISPRRFVWPDVPKLKSVRDAEERLLEPRMRANKMFYAPLFAAGVVATAFAVTEAGAIGMAVVTASLTPPLLAAIATLRAWLAVRSIRRDQP